MRVLSVTRVVVFLCAMRCFEVLAGGTCLLPEYVNYKKLMALSGREVKAIFNGVKPEGTFQGEKTWATTPELNQVLKVPNNPKDLKKVEVLFQIYRGKVVALDYGADGVPTPIFF